MLTALQLRAMAQQQTQIEGRQGKGLAGTGRGLDQPLAMERKAHGIQ